MTAQKHDSATFRHAHLLGSPDKSKLVPARHILATSAILLKTAKLSVIIDLRRFAGSASLSVLSPLLSAPGFTGPTFPDQDAVTKANLGMFRSH